MHLGVSEAERPATSAQQKDKIIAERKKHIDEISMPDFVTAHLSCIELEPDGENFEKINCE
eukprot:8545549-Pyramimonas_sp.AAC.1